MRTNAVASLKFIILTNKFIFVGNHKYFIYAEKIRNLFHQGEGTNMETNSVTSRHLQCYKYCAHWDFLCYAWELYGVVNTSFMSYDISKLGASVSMIFMYTRRHQYYKPVIIPATVDDFLCICLCICIYFLEIPYITSKLCILLYLSSLKYIFI